MAESDNKVSLLQKLKNWFKKETKAEREFINRDNWLCFHFEYIQDLDQLDIDVVDSEGVVLCSITEHLDSTTGLKYWKNITEEQANRIDPKKNVYKGADILETKKHALLWLILGARCYPVYRTLTADNVAAHLHQTEPPVLCIHAPGMDKQHLFLVPEILPELNDFLTDVTWENEDKEVWNNLVSQSLSHLN